MDEIEADARFESENAHHDEEAQRDVVLPSGRELELADAADVMRASVARLIVIAGAAESGKTTLIASIFDAFQNGQFAGYMFAGSLTLVGFEQRCHLARLASGMAEPDTQHTPIGDSKLLDLDVRSVGPGGIRRKLLFSDIQGEVFRRAADSTDDCKQLVILKRADHFVLLIDGARLTDSTTRHSANHESASLLRSCLDADMLSDSSLVDVLVTKADIVASSTGASELESYIDHLKADYARRFSSRLARLRFGLIASRPRGPNFDLCHGLKEFFPSWVEDTSLFYGNLKETRANILALRYYDKYMFCSAGFGPIP